ncbi:LPXTG cell wall anchor domain-containing protein [Embleya scabrispora]|uniref:LPXTG cell wall anchor domain-containing protein n=1 Tax=Embleya scabrispora TaxID=159449 RepID=UPI0003823D5C|nr:LPXTG cell wall anchor domain-containing protein [Embleya scabrispora]MYS82809.1 LPXTG cell wall anchor domain-containing protein [Streptomyces sp. SID5474]
MSRFTKKIGVSAAAAITLALTPILPGMAGTAYACGDGDGKQVSATTADQTDWEKVSVTLSGVPAKVTRGSTFTARLTVTNNSKVELGRIPVGVGLGLIDQGENSPDGRLHHGGAKDVAIRYTLPGQAPQNLPVKPGCDPVLGGRFVISGGGHPGSRTTVTMQVTIKTSTPVQVTDGHLSAGVPRGQNVYRQFALGQATAQPTPPTKPTPTKPAPAKPAQVREDTKPAETTPSAPTATAALPAALPKTGGPSHAPALAAAAVGLVLLGTTTIVLTRRRRPTA